jgi:hypothetical protein
MRAKDLGGGDHGPAAEPKLSEQLLKSPRWLETGPRGGEKDTFKNVDALTREIEDRPRAEHEDERVLVAALLPDELNARAPPWDDGLPGRKKERSGLNPEGILGNLLVLRRIDVHPTSVAFLRLAPAA